jgi:TPP-dependent indolepyruvate ferredoxin oxidoreductase alpha subunit
MLMGNEALGRGLFESGCSLVASYPGTPASEILSSVVPLVYLVYLVHLVYLVYLVLLNSPLQP